MNLAEAIARGRRTAGRVRRGDRGGGARHGAGRPRTDSATCCCRSRPPHYAVREAYVTELERVPTITPVPHVPAWVRGVTNLRGDILSVIDMRTFLGLEASSSHSARMLVVRLLDEEFATGLLVDASIASSRCRPAQITPPASSLDGPLAPYPDRRVRDRRAARRGARPGSAAPLVRDPTVRRTHRRHRSRRRKPGTHDYGAGRRRRSALRQRGFIMRRTLKIKTRLLLTVGFVAAMLAASSGVALWQAERHRAERPAGRAGRHAAWRA